MSAVAAAIGVGAIGGALISANASTNAANTEANAANNASLVQQNMFNTEMANSQEAINHGIAANDELSGGVFNNGDLTRKFTMSDFQQDPGYQFQLTQGEQAVSRSAAAKGMLNSTGTQQGLNNYAQGMANTDYQQALTNFTNNQQQRYNMLSGISQQGLAAGNMTNQVGMNAANNIGSNIMGAGNATAAAQIAGGNAISSGINGLANGYMNYSAMNNLTNNTQPGSSPYTNSNYQMPSMGSQPSYGAGGADPLGYGSLLAG